MPKLHPQYIKDAKGNKAFVVLTIEEFNAIIEELEDIDDVRLYDEAKRNDTGERISFADFLKAEKPATLK